VDDEIDLLKPHVIFLEEKGYDVDTACDGEEAIEKVTGSGYDLIFLDENMPGLSGLETLQRMKSIRPETPVIMITKSEEEEIMDEAIGSQISDYLIKPVNPKQILLSIKKHIDIKRLVSEKTTSDYQIEFSQIGMKISQSFTFDDWADIYKKIVYWELELEKGEANEMKEVLKMQKSEANNEFAKYIKSNYYSWFDKNNNDCPLMSHTLLKNRVIPLLEQGEKVFFIFIDNLRYDQWRTLFNDLHSYFELDTDELFCSIIPTTTQYSRNAMFAGLMPYEIDKIIPGLWLNDEDEGGKNMHEEELLRKQLNRYGLNVRFNYEKVFNKAGERKIIKNFKGLMNNQLNVVVYNFVDMLSHARTNVDMIKELADDEAAYRSLTLSWFRHSQVFDLLKMLATEEVKVVVTTDHGSIRVNNPVKVIAGRETSSNLRFKAGKNLSYNPKEVFEIKDISKAHLPERNISYSYIFARNNDYFVYPNNYNYYVSYFRNTFQHGGVSLEEMLIPFAIMSPK
jgi:CheY-like chemotaxis protein